MRTEKEVEEEYLDTGVITNKTLEKIKNRLKLQSISFNEVFAYRRALAWVLKK